jgi:Ser/Thr protein kinase RdoA (MazF antagonist)
VDRLAELHFPAPRLVATREGESFVNRQGELYALFDFVGGTNYTANYLLRSHRWKLMALAGQTLARFHRQLEGFVPQGHHHMGFAAYTGQRRRDLAWHANKIQELTERSGGLSRPEEKIHTDWLIQNSSAMLEELGRLDETLHAAQLSRLVIHGDYGLHNVLFQNDGTVTPVDFELSRIEWRLSDLVSCLSRFRFGKGPYNFESMQWFMQAYQTEFPLSADEWRCFPQVWRFYKTMGAVQYWNSYFETGGPTRKLISARDALRQADWALNHPQTLLDLNTGVTRSFAIDPDRTGRKIFQKG